MLDEDRTDFINKYERANRLLEMLEKDSIAYDEDVAQTIETAKGDIETAEEDLDNLIELMEDALSNKSMSCAA